MAEGDMPLCGVDGGVRYGTAVANSGLEKDLFQVMKL